MSERRAAIVAEFYRQRRADLFTYAVWACGEEQTAEDLVHDVIRRLLERPLLPRDLPSFALRCLRNAAIDARRLSSRRRELLAALPLPAAPRPDGDLQRLLATALGRLSPEERETIVLKEVFGLTTRQVGRVMGVSPNTAGSRHRRGPAKLKRIIEEEPR
jgi:RNA polymerase sigma factor (sigma-70 family)